MMTHNTNNTLPAHTITPRPAAWNPARIANWDWASIEALPPLQLAQGTGPARFQTQVRLCADPENLYVRFDCHDEDIWGTYTQRDDPIYDEEVVELFLAPGTEPPVTYYEFEVSPNSVLLDVLIHNPTEIDSGNLAGARQNLRADFAWDCPNLVWMAERNDAENQWWAILAVPWSSVGAGDALPPLWRANLYRIERPRNGTPEFSCWSPTLTNPPNYHVPHRFGYFNLQSILELR